MSEASRFGVGQEPTDQHCSICGAIYTGFGHNAQPVNDGRCCEKCNREIVTPQRIVAAYTKQ